MRKRHTQIILAGSAIAALALLYLASPTFRGLVQQSIDLLARADIEQMRDYLLSFGVWAPVMSALLMVLQALLLPLPSMALTLANGLLFGTIWGALLSWSSAMVAAVVCYYIARLFGRPLVGRLVGERSLGLVDRFFRRHGRYAVLIGRLIPFISFDMVSYGAGLSSVGLGEFILATGLGQLPATILYSYLGQNAPQAARVGLWIVLGLGAFVALALVLKSRFEESLLAE